MTTFNLGEPLEYLPYSLPDFSPRSIEEEPMLFQCNVASALRFGSGLTAALLSEVHRVVSDDVFGQLRIDTRSHMLMPGWYPCIPGWHCDFMETNGRFQVARSVKDVATRHFQFVSGGPLPERTTRRHLALSTENSCITWGAVDKELGALVSDSVALRTMRAGIIHEFDATELHRGNPHRGEPGHWRWFFRASYFPSGHQHRTFANKVRRQAQIYCDIHEGW